MPNFNLLSHWLFPRLAEKVKTPGDAALAWDLSQQLGEAWKLVRRSQGAAGVDRMTIQQFARDQDRRLKSIARRTEDGEYEFERLKRVKIPKSDGGSRQLEIPTVCDRIVLQAIRLILQPRLESQMSAACYAYRHGRGVHHALAAIRAGLADSRTWIVKSDIRQFFDTIDHAHLKRSLSAYAGTIGGHRLLWRGIEISAEGRPRRIGLAQGSPLSPLLANASLIDFDHELSQMALLARYADDFIIALPSKREAKQALAMARRKCREMRLQLHPRKTWLIDAKHQAFDFLGFRITPDQIRPSEPNCQKLRDAIDHWLSSRHRLGSKQRSEGLNAVIRSFVWYYHTTDCDRMLLDFDARIRSRLKTLQQLHGADETPSQESILVPSQLRHAQWKPDAKPRGQAAGWSGYG